MNSQAHPLHPLSFSEDVLAAQGGDRDAFARLVDATKGVVCAISLAIVRDVAFSEDVAQNVFVAAWSGLATLRNPESFLPWLRQLTRNKAKESVRGRARFRRRHEAWPEVSGEDAPLDVADTSAGADPVSALISEEEHAALRAAIEALPEETREIVTLFYREGQSVRQVASLLDVSEDAVKKRLERARDALRASVRERFTSALERTAPAAAFTAGVLAVIAMPKAAAAAGASTAATKLASTASVAKGGLLATAFGFAAVAVLLLGLLGGLLTPRAWRDTTAADAAPTTALRAMTNDAARSAQARYPHGVRDPARADDLRERLLAAAAERQSASEAGQALPASAAGPERGRREATDVEEFSRFVTQAIREDFVPLARDCAKQLAARRPNAHGTAVVAFELLGDAKIGGVVNSAEVDRAKSTLADPEFDTCVSESLTSICFDPPPGGGRATLNFPITVLEGEGGAIDEEVEDFHIKDRR